MKSKSFQFEFNLGKAEPFQLLSESGTDSDRVQKEEEHQRKRRVDMERAQWWFEQMQKAVDRA